MRVPDDKYADTDHQYAGPAQRGHHGIRKRGRRLNVTVVRPSENQHVYDEKTEQAGNPQPDVTGTEDSEENMQDVARGPGLSRANTFHAFAQQDIAQWREHDHEQNEKAGLEVQARRIFHAIYVLLQAPRTLLVLPAIQRSLQIE